VICSKGILCAFCVKDFYPDKAYEKGICRCSICHPKFLQYEWFHEVVSAHYETYPSKNENHFGEWLYKLIKVVLERLCEADDGELVEPPNDPFEVLREELSRVYPKKKLPAKKSNKLRKLQETSSCHLCHKKEVECASEMLWCEAPNCGLVFCRTRLEKYHYDHYAGFDDTKELFICPRCEGICLCSKCNMKKADETMMTSNKTRRQWMIYYLYNIHIFAGDRMLYEVIRSIMPSTNLIAKLASHLLLMYAPPAH